MAKSDRFRKLGLVLIAQLLALMGALTLTHLAAAQSATPAPLTNADCVNCHAKPGQTMKLPSGEIITITVSADTLAHSVHGSVGIGCQNCHTNIHSFPHPPLPFQTRRELQQSYYLNCVKCHETNFVKTQDSIHAQMAANGKSGTPVCIDCHGAHDVQPPQQPRAHISQICGQCHTQIYNQYKGSVHGAALINENNTDVPVCTDCHGVHNIQDPRTVQFRVQTPELCARCHANKQLMAKYGLDPNVYSIYKTSWHGVDVSVYQARWPTLWHSSAVCTDCHGVHDILPTEDPKSKVNKANLLATCRTCHPNAPPNWTGAWTGHHQITLASNPAAFYTQSFYGDFIPIVLWISVIYVILQLIRLLVARARRSM